jgi:hypothetical protein
LDDAGKKYPKAMAEKATGVRKRSRMLPNVIQSTIVKKRSNKEKVSIRGTLHLRRVRSVKRGDAVTTWWRLTATGNDRSCKSSDDDVKSSGHDLLLLDKHRLDAAYLT